MSFVLKAPELCFRVTTLTFRGLSRQRRPIPKPQPRTKSRPGTNYKSSTKNSYQTISPTKWGRAPYLRIAGQVVFSLGFGYYIYSARVFDQAMALQDSQGRLSDFFRTLQKGIVVEEGDNVVSFEYNKGEDAAIDIIISVCVTSVVCLFLAKRGFNVIQRFGSQPNAAFWTPFTNIMIHGSYAHLLFNMVALFNFKPDSIDPSESMNRFQLPAFLLAAGLTSSMFSVIVKTVMRSSVPSVGASGAIYAMVFYQLFKHPDNQYSLIFGPDFTFTAKTLAKASVVIELIIISAFRGRSPFDHACHFGGMLFGYVYFKYLEERWWTVPVAQAKRDIEEVIDVISDK